MRQSAYFFSKRKTPPAIKATAHVSPREPPMLPMNRSKYGVSFISNLNNPRGVAVVTVSTADDLKVRGEIQVVI